MKRFPRFAAGLLGLALFASCTKDDAPEYTIPDTYTFSPMNFEGQTIRLDMLERLTAYAKTGNDGAVLDADRLADLFANEGAPFGDERLDASGKRLRDKVFAPDLGYFDQALVNLAASSASAGAPASNGQAGIVANGASAYLVDGNGVEWTQLVEKGLMGACFLYQAVGNYLSVEGMDVDNAAVDPVNGTEMAHHWDEAWGYTAFPADFGSAADPSGLRFWAKYVRGRENGLPGLSDRLAAAFRTGRAAIGAKDYATRDAQIAVIAEEWERASGATAIHYLNAAMADFGDDAVRCHALSEALAFARGARYVPEPQLDAAGLAEVEALIGLNFWTVTLADLQAARERLATAYGIANPAAL